jgi:hypothetical protein
MGNNVFQSPFNITSAAIVAALGYAPVNKAGDTMTGDLKFTDASFDIGKSGATRPRDGFFSRDLVVGQTLTSGNATIGASGWLGWSGMAFMRASGAGKIRLGNAAETDFDMIQFGGTTSSFPAIKRYPSAALFQFRTADDSAFVGVELGHVRLAARTVAQIGSAGGSGTGSLTCVTDANATTRHSVVAGGGSNKVLVYSDGTNWLIV